MSTAHQDFDPAQVPVFPVLNLEVTPGGGARLGGRVLVVPTGQDPTAVAVAAAAAEAALLPGDLGAIRVRATDAAGNVHAMVIRADGSTFDTTPKVAAKHPAWWLPAATVAAVVILGAVVLATVAIMRSDATPPTAAAPAGGSMPAPLVGAGSNLPIPAPPGYAQQATWAVPVDSQVPPVATADGDLLAKNTDGNLILIDAASGRTRWTGKHAGSDKLHTFTSDGQTIAATSTSTQISLWALPAKDAKAAPDTPADPITVALPSQATVSYDGGAPLVTLPDQTAAFVSNGALTRVDVPVGATALAATSTSVIAAGPGDAWYTLTPGGSPVVKHLPPVPVVLNAFNSPSPDTVISVDRTIAAGPNHLVAVWQWNHVQTHQEVVVYDLGTGQIVTSRLASPGEVNDLTQVPLVRQEGGDHLVFGSQFVDFSATPTVIDIGDWFTATTLTNGHVYGKSDDWGMRDVQITGQKMGYAKLPDPVPGAAPVPVPAPVATTPVAAYVTAAKVEQFLLYAVPAIPGGQS
jgi:hypothetical protein